MNKPSIVKIIIILIVLLALIVGGYIYWKNVLQKTPEEKAAEVIDESIKAVTGAALPEITTETNPLEKAPDINPVSKTNPFKNINLNPFK